MLPAQATSPTVPTPGIFLDDRLFVPLINLSLAPPITPLPDEVDGVNVLEGEVAALFGFEI